MKKLLLTVTLCLACAAAFAQGKIRLVNDSVHLVYFTTDTSHLNDSTLSGQAYQQGMGGSGTNLTIQLWAGTSSLALSLAGSTAFGPAGAATPGTFPGANVLLSGIAAGATAYFQVDIFDSTAGSYLLASTLQNYWYGQSSIFTAVAGSTAYNSIVSHSAAPGAASTWTDGTYAVGGSLPGATGAIALSINVPEPGTIALAGLGAAALMIFRRRK